MTGPVAFHDLPDESFPFTVEWIAQRTGKVVHAAIVTGPGALEVPALWPAHGPCSVRVVWGDGTVMETDDGSSVRRLT